MVQKMASLDSEKASSNWGHHENLHQGMGKGLNGSIMSCSWVWSATWLTRPNQVLISVVEVGQGKSLIASRYFGSGSMVESDTLNPSKLILLLVK